MPLVKMPDGQLVDMPENPSPEQLAGLQALAQKQSSIPEGVKEAGRVLDQTVRGGLTALPRMAKSVYEATGQPARDRAFLEALPELFQPNVQRAKLGLLAVDQLMTPSQPKTRAGQVIGNIGEAAVGALASPGGMVSPLRSAATGAASGAGAEGAAALFGDNALTRILGGLLGGGASSLLTAAPTNRAQVAKAALRDVDEIDLRNAKAVMEDRLKAGTPINLSQAMDRNSNIDKLVDVLANSKEGVNVTDMLRRQPAQVEGQATGFLNSLPGNVLPRTNMANQAQEAATEVINQARRQRTEVWERALAAGLSKHEAAALPAVRAAEAKVREAQDSLAKLVAERAARSAADSEAKQAAAQLQKALTPKPIEPPASTFPVVPEASSRLRDLPQQGAAINLQLLSREARQTPPGLLGADGLPMQAPQALSLPKLPESAPFLAGPQRQAEKVLAQAQTSLGQAKQRLMATSTVPDKAVLDVQKFLTAEAAARPNTQQAAWLQQLSAKLVDDVGMPLSDPKQINEVLKEAAASLKMPNMNTPGIDAGAAKYLSSVINQTRQQLGESFAPIRDANAAYSAFTQARVNPLREGVVGAIAQPAGAVEGKAAAAGKLFTLLDKGSDPRARVSDISTLAKELNKSGQGDVFTNGVKSWMSEKLAHSMKEAGGRSADDIADVIHKSFFRTDLQKQGFRDMMAGVADAQGVPRQQLVTGAERFFDYVGRAARRPATASGISGEELRRVAEGSVFGKLGQVSVITPLRQPVLKWVDWLRSDAYSAMDKLVTSPEGVDMLIKLSKEKRMSPAAVNAMATFLGTATAANNPPTITAE